jgi:hypothetical protein
MMAHITRLNAIELVPLVELSPLQFATKQRETPNGSSAELPDEWHRYWVDSLGDAGVVGVAPLYPGSWHVATTELSAPETIRRVIEVTFRDEGGIGIFADPELERPLSGGIALFRRRRELVIEPTCCTDLGDLHHWRKAAVYRGDEWETLWIGHPWVSMRYESPWLILSDLHEGGEPSARWAVRPEDVGGAVTEAEAELLRFATRVADVLPEMGWGGDADRAARKIVGLDDPRFSE